MILEIILIEQMYNEIFFLYDIKDAEEGHDSAILMCNLSTAFYTIN